MKETMKETEKETEKVQIKNENDFLNKLSDIRTQAEDFSLLGEGVKKGIEDKQQEIFDFINNNDPSAIEDEDEKNKLFMTMIDLWGEMKDLIKNAVCNIELTNLELKVMSSKLHQSVEYTSETIFYGLHIKKHFLNNLPKPKGGDFVSHTVPITFTQSVGLYHVLSETTVKGLNKETFAYANILYTLSLVTELYNYFDRLSAYTSKQMHEWNMGLRKEADAGTETEEQQIEMLKPEPGTPNMKVEK